MSWRRHCRSLVHRGAERRGGPRSAGKPACGRGVTRQDPNRLTAQEQRVARLATAGHSNKVIAGQLSLSTKTIEYHLAQVYTKLGITSRL